MGPAVGRTVGLGTGHTGSGAVMDLWKPHHADGTFLLRGEVRGTASRRVLWPGGDSAPIPSQLSSSHHHVLCSLKDEFTVAAF